MPESRRVKAYNFTSVKKKTGHSRKLDQVNRIRQFLTTCRYAYVIKFQNFKTSVLQEIREFVNDGTIFMGANRIMQVALGATPEQAYKKGTDKLAAFCVNAASLLFTDKTKEELEQFIQQYLHENIFAVAGDISCRTVVVTQETMDALQLPSTMLPLLESLGLKSKLDMGRFILLENLNVCNEGELLDATQAKLLKQLNIPVASRKFKIFAVYDSKTNDVEHCI